MRPSVGGSLASHAAASQLRDVADWLSARNAATSGDRVEPLVLSCRACRLCCFLFVAKGLQGNRSGRAGDASKRFGVNKANSETAMLCRRPSTKVGGYFLLKISAAARRAICRKACSRILDRRRVVSAAIIRPARPWARALRKKTSQDKQAKASQKRHVRCRSPISLAHVREN
jgi:hypothetical protein